MPERNWSSEWYRYGFQGQEKDDEIKGEENSYTFTFRIYDSRLGKFLSIDPLKTTYPWYTTYQFTGNTPIASIDLDGLEEYWVIARSFIPQPKLSNPDPLSMFLFPYYRGDNRKEYRANAGKSFRTEQFVYLNFNKLESNKNQFASPTTALNNKGEFIKTSAGSHDAGSIETSIGLNNGKVNFEINSTNELASSKNPFTPAIDAIINVSIEPQKDGSFDYSVDIPKIDGFPAYELWVNDDKDNSYLLFGRNPIESNESPFSLFGSGEHSFKFSGNSKDLISKPSQSFEERANPKEED